MPQIIARLWLFLIVLLVGNPVQAATIDYIAYLNGASEFPPNASSGTGFGHVAYDSIAHTLLVQIDFTGLSGITTASHLHCCTASPDTGTAGVATQTPSFSGFPLGVFSGTYENTFDLTLASSWNAAFLTNNGGTAAGAEAAFADGLKGRVYLNIHTDQFPGGEIRGFLHQVPEPATIALLGIGLVAIARRQRINLSREMY